jgi:hypothetical protein
MNSHARVLTQEVWCNVRVQSGERNSEPRDFKTLDTGFRRMTDYYPEIALVGLLELAPDLFFT